MQSRSLRQATTWHRECTSKRVMRYHSIVSVIVLGLLLATPGFSNGQIDEPETTRPDAACPAPVSTCGDDTASMADCPQGFRCTCVPSCPNCRDCAARVCIADPVRQCRTACDCDPGLGCFDGQCIAGFAPVYCCDGRQCPVGEQCQHPDESMDRCGAVCTAHVWRCEAAGQNDACTDGRICSCTASCPLCEDCGPGVCVPPGVPTPYRCAADRSCQRGDRCVCVSSCPGCDDCAATVCVPACDDPMCEKRQKQVAHVTGAIVDRAARCNRDEQCVRIDTSTGCQGTCGAWINRHYLSRVERYLDRIDQRYCASYREDGCTFITPRCRNEVAACVEGQCIGVVPSLSSAAE